MNQIILWIDGKRVYQGSRSDREDVCVAGMCSWSHADGSAEMALQLKLEGQVGIGGKSSVKV